LLLPQSVSFNADVAVGVVVVASKCQFQI